MPTPEPALYDCAACETQGEGAFAAPWYLPPTGWLALVQDDNELAFACSLDCASALTDEEGA